MTSISKEVIGSDSTRMNSLSILIPDSTDDNSLLPNTILHPLAKVLHPLV